MGLTTLSPDATVDEVVAIIERDGGVIIQDFVDTATVEALEADLRPVLDAHEYGVDGYFAGKRTRRLGALFKHTKHGERLVMHRLFQGAAEYFLCRPTPCWTGDELVEMVPNMQIGVTQVIDIYPGEGSQPLHRDDMIWQWRHPKGGRQGRVQIMFALTDFTADNGGTLVIPGSHLWDDERQPRREEALPTVMKAGSALIWIGGTYHAGGQNQTDGSRTGITITLDLGYLRQEENQYLAYTLDEVKGFSEGLQKLLGYQACPPFMGYVEHRGIMHDPHFLVSPDEHAVNQAPLGNRPQEVNA